MPRSRTLDSQGLGTRNSVGGLPLASLLPSYIAFRVDFDPPGPYWGCWLWRAGCNSDGYAQFRHHRKTVKVGRYVFQLVNGFPPVTMEHQCHTHAEWCNGGIKCLHRRCVNPFHIISLTAKANSQLQHSYWARRTQCKWGHELSADNVRIIPQPNGRPGMRRICVTCARRNSRATRARARARRLAETQEALRDTA